VAQEGGLLAKLLSLPVFILAVALAVVLARSLARRGRRALPALLTAEALLVLGATPTHADDVAVLAAGGLAICAQG
jgi:uncharacterized membrane protein YoaK (UPF0700 family)